MPLSIASTPTGAPGRGDTLPAFMRSPGHDVPWVDHARPIHDRLCRCRACKPPLVGATARTLARTRLALTLGAAATAVLIVAGAGA